MRSYQSAIIFVKERGNKKERNNRSVVQSVPGLAWVKFSSLCLAWLGLLELQTPPTRLDFSLFRLGERRSRSAKLINFVTSRDRQCRSENAGLASNDVVKDH